ncbi:MAG: hypothetical protein AUH85_11050 [Chloroflexi bacterium 13_1_40CM_4_68_4]|nr:MAG: hypothetical protein AUH85_11050 [Chloroflexi bacterium 13_1_40CM_4_68_4]
MVSIAGRWAWLRTSNEAAARERKPAPRQARRGGWIPADLAKLRLGARAGREQHQCVTLLRAQPCRRPVEGRATLGCDGECRLRALASRRAKTSCPSGGDERGRKHCAERVGQRASVFRREPAREEDLMGVQHRRGVHESTDGLHRRHRHAFAENDAERRSRTEWHAHE